MVRASLAYGAPYVCRNLKLYHIDEPGGMAEYRAVNSDRIHRAPAGLPADLVVPAEPLAVAVHAVRTSLIGFGDFVCVIGGGTIGLLIAMVARGTEGQGADVVFEAAAAGDRGIWVVFRVGD